MVASVGIKRDVVLKALCAASICLLAIVLLTGRQPLLAYADNHALTSDTGIEPDGTLLSAVQIVFTIIRIICAVLGGFFLIFGVVKIAIAYANENPQEQTKAMMMLASGIVLVVLVTVVINNTMARSLAIIITKAKNL